MPSSTYPSSCRCKFNCKCHSNNGIIKRPFEIINLLSKEPLAIQSYQDVVCLICPTEKCSQ